MTGELARLFVSLFGDTSHFDKNISDSQKKLQQVSKNMSAIGKKMTMFVTLPLMGIGVAALKVASDAEEMESKFNVVFGELAEETKAWSESFGDSIGRSTSSVMKWMAALQDTFVPLGFARAEGAEMSKTLAQLTVDMASFNNESEANVIRDLQSALVGNHETVRKYGVIITQATLGQELMNMGIEGGIKEATEQEKVLARMNIILEGTSDAQGDAARTADSFANRMRALKESSKDLLINIGQQLIPIISKLVEKINQAVDWFNDLDEGQQKLIITVAGVLAVVGPLLLGIAKMIPLLGTMKIAFVGLNAVMSANPILGIVAAALALGAAAIFIIKNWDKVRLWFIKAYVTIVDFFEGLISWVLKSPDWVAYLLAAFVPFIGLPMLLIKNWEAFSNGIERIVKAVVEFSIKAFDAMKIGILSAVVGMIEGVRRVVQVFGKETPKLDQAVKGLNERINGLRDHMQNVQGPTIELSDIFKNMNKNAKSLRQSMEDLENQNEDLDEGEKELIDTGEDLQGVIGGVTESIEEANETTGRYVFTLARMNIGIREITGSEVLSALYEQARALAEIESKAWVLTYTYDDLNTKVAELTGSDIVSQLYQQRDALYETGELVYHATLLSENLSDSYVDLTEKIKLLREEEARAAEERRRIFIEWVSIVHSVGMQISSIFSEMYRNREIELDNWYQKQKETIDNMGLTEEEHAEKMEGLDEELARKKRKLAREQAIREKNLAMFEIFVNTARAVVQALPRLILAAIIGVLGAAQLAAVSRRPLPELEEGALLKKSTIFLGGEGRDEEAVMPLNEKVFGQFAKGIVFEMQKIRTLGGAAFASPGNTVNLNVGTLVADDLSLKKLERRLRDIRLVEDQRLGVGA